MNAVIAVATLFPNMVSQCPHECGLANSYFPNTKQKFVTDLMAADHDQAGLRNKNLLVLTAQTGNLTGHCTLWRI